MSKLVEALAVTAELTGTEWSKAAAMATAQELSSYPEMAVMESLMRCRRELKGKLTLSDILSRLPGRHPGAEQAWAIMAPKVKNDGPTVFVTDPMREAYGAALALDGDLVAARMAFKETYTAAVNIAEANGDPPKWSMMPGTDPRMKEVAIQEAVKKGIVNKDWALRQLPVEAHSSLLQLVGDTKVKRIA